MYYANFFGSKCLMGRKKCYTSRFIGKSNWGGVNKKEASRIMGCFLRDSCRIQTCNLLIRSQMLYSIELTNHSLFFQFITGVTPFLNCDAKLLPFFETAKFFGCFFLKNEIN